MSDIELSFDWSGHKVRVVGTPERPEWVAVDACRALGLAHTATSLRKIPERFKGVCRMHTVGRGAQNHTTLTEPGLWRLVLRSDKPEAIAFQDWVCEEVLPAIRKHGAFTIGVADAAAMLGETGAIMNELLAQNTKLIEKAQRMASHAGSALALYKHMPRNDPRQLALEFGRRAPALEEAK